MANTAHATCGGVNIVPQTAYAARDEDSDEDYAAPRHHGRSKWDVPKGKSAADKNKELGLEQKRRMERLQSKGVGSRRKSAGGSAAGAGGGKDDEDGPKITCVAANAWCCWRW